MPSFEDFYEDVIKLAKKYESQNVPLKIERDPDSDTIKLFGENITPVTRAKNGLADISELVYTTAEHHPYWRLLSGCSDVADVVLESWNNSLSSKNLSDIDWALTNLTDSLEKVRQKHRDDS